jgi:BMFP domain-containing protein YqiC
MKGQTIEIRFGIAAIDKGFITAEQLIEALRTQIIGDIEQKDHKLIGTILLEMGLVTREQIDEVVKELANKRMSKLSPP